MFNVTNKEFAYSFPITKCMPRKIRFDFIDTQQAISTIVPAHVRDPVSKVYKISESMIALMLSVSVRLDCRRQKRDPVIKISATDDIDSPKVNTHPNFSMNPEYVFRRIISDVETQAEPRRKVAAIRMGHVISQFLLLSMNIRWAKKQWTKNVSRAVSTTVTAILQGITSVLPKSPK